MPAPRLNPIDDRVAGQHSTGPAWRIRTQKNLAGFCPQDIT